MGIERFATQTTGSDKLTYTNLEPGEYEARLIHVADLGLQKREAYRGGADKSDCQQITLCFEVLGSTVELNGKEVPRTLWTSSINIFDKMLSMGNELPLYRAFVPSALEDSVPDWEAQLGKPVTLNVTNKESGGRTYDNISGVAAIPLKYQDNVAPAVTTEFSVGGCEELDSPAIKNLRGYQKKTHENRILTKVANAGSKPQAVAEEEETLSDEVPF
jgi:hypothetical protein